MPLTPDSHDLAARYGKTWLKNLGSASLPRQRPLDTSKNIHHRAGHQGALRISRV